MNVHTCVPISLYMPVGHVEDWAVTAAGSQHGLGTRTEGLVGSASAMVLRCVWGVGGGGGFENVSGCGHMNAQPMRHNEGGALHMTSSQGGVGGGAGAGRRGCGGSV